MGKLGAALAWAARDFRVFPLQVNSRDPIADLAWTAHATTDPETIRMWWTDPVTGFELENNIGFLTSGWIVADVDVKNGKRGLQTFSELGMDFDTLVNRTPSGGYHLVYRGLETPVGSSHLVSPQDGIDIKSHNGYVVAPGSTLDGVPYVVELDLPVAEFPEHLRCRLKAPRTRAAATVPSVDLDAPEVLEIAAYYLKNQAPNSPQGSRGYTCFQVSCRLRDFGVSEVLATEMLLDLWNDRNEPPMPLEDLLFTANNAYRYATGEAGSLAPANAFGDIVAVRPPKVIHAPATILPQGMHQPGAGGTTAETYRFGNMMDVDDIDPRPWVMGSLLLSKIVTTLISAPGGGKSTFNLILAAHLAVGKDFMGHKCMRSGKSIIYNAEDDLKEASRRLNAICDVYGFDRDIVRNSISLLSSDDLDLKLTVNKPPTLNHNQIMALITAALDNNVVLIVVDPLSEAHSANENDNPEMVAVMSVLRMIARQADCAVVAVHHTGKPPAAASTAWVGNQNAGRGASSVAGAARKVLTLFPAAVEDCIDIGVAPDQRTQYVRLDEGKSSYAPSNRTKWLRWQTAVLTNSDTVGVLLEHNASEAQDTMAAGYATALARVMLETGAASLTAEQAVAILEKSDPMSSKEERTTLKSRVTRLLERPVKADGGMEVFFQATNDEGKREPRFVMR